MEVYLSVDTDKKQLVKSLFKYDATVRNPSEEGIDDFSIHFLPSNEITLAQNPRITSTPPGLLAALRIRRIVVERGALYSISLLNPEQSLSFALFGFSTEVVNPSSLTVIVQKKDWIQRNVEEADIGQERRIGFIQKPVADYNGYDALFISIFIGLIFVGLFVYVQMFAVMLRRYETRRRERAAERRATTRPFSR